MQHEQDELARQVDSLATQLEEAQQATEEAEKAAAEARGRSALLEKSWAAAQEVGVQRAPLARPPAVPLCGLLCVDYAVHSLPSLTLSPPAPAPLTHNHHPPTRLQEVNSLTAERRSLQAALESSQREAAKEATNYATQQELSASLAEQLEAARKEAAAAQVLASDARSRSALLEKAWTSTQKVGGRVGGLPWGALPQLHSRAPASRLHYACTPQGAS